MKRVLPMVVLVMSLLLVASPVIAASPVVVGSPIPVDGTNLSLIDAPPSLEKPLGSSPAIAVETTTTSTTSSGLFSAGPSSPNYIFMYGANTWSQFGYWNLTNNTTIPNGATVTQIREYWSQSQYITNLHVALFPGNLNGYYVPYSGCNIPEFAGQPIKQNWSTKAYCDKTGNSYPAWITPVLYINWTAPASSASPASSGVTTLAPNGASETQIISSN